MAGRPDIIMDFPPVPVNGYLFGTQAISRPISAQSSSRSGQARFEEHEGLLHTNTAEGDGLVASEKGKARPPKGRKIYWAIPATASGLYLLGLGAAIGHCIFFNTLNEQPVKDQTWTFRYSLALAFVFKSSLAASISTALAQIAWATLRNSRQGTSIFAIDALFLSGSSIFKFLSPSLWKSAAGPALIAACIWLMPFTALVAPTALTVGNSTFTSINGNCSVPTLKWGLSPFNDSYATTAHSLYTSDEGDQSLLPSTDSKRLSAAVLDNGRQTGWDSPCGANCTYEIDFIGPSWQCTLVANVDDPRAPWVSHGKSWFGKNGSTKKITGEGLDSLDYGTIYQAALNTKANQFWASFATVYARTYNLPASVIGKTYAEVLDVEAYYCEFVNTSYTMQVSYNDKVQNNTLLKADPFSRFQISSDVWKGSEASLVSPSLQDVVGMYLPMIDTIRGSMYKDPRVGVVAGTSVGMVPTLIQNIKVWASTYGAGTPFLPRINLGPLLEELSHNLTISLMSNPDLLITSRETVTCHSSHTETVWKVNWLPIVIAYSVGLGAALGCLIIGAYALATNGIAHDTSFSSVVRTTRNEEFDTLFHREDVGALPLAEEQGARKLKFVQHDPNDLDDAGNARRRMGFVLGS